MQSKDKADCGAMSSRRCKVRLILDGTSTRARRDKLVQVPMLRWEIEEDVSGGVALEIIPLMCRYRRVGGQLSFLVSSERNEVEDRGK